MEENMKRILVVDDEQDLCEILKFNLETEGYEVETANSSIILIHVRNNSFYHIALTAGFKNKSMIFLLFFTIYLPEKQY